MPQKQESQWNFWFRLKIPGAHCWYVMNNSHFFDSFFWLTGCKNKCSWNEFICKYTWNIKGPLKWEFQSLAKQESSSKSPKEYYGSSNTKTFARALSARACRILVVDLGIIWTHHLFTFLASLSPLGILKNGTNIIWSSWKDI